MLWFWALLPWYILYRMVKKHNKDRANCAADSFDRLTPKMQRELWVVATKPCTSKKG